MASWITVHYPHPIDDGVPYVVYLTEGMLKLGQKLRRGDSVFFYCGKFPPIINGTPVTKITKQVDGRVDLVPLERTAGGIIGLATAEGGVHPKSELGVQIYDYGNSASWQYYVPCTNFRRGRVISLQAFRQIAGKGLAVRTGLYQIPDDLQMRLRCALGVDLDPQEALYDAPRETVVHALEMLLKCGIRDAERLLKRIEETRGQAERNMEDVVKQTLLSLGHQENAITFRVGFMDIRVTMPGGACTVIEVKRDLTFSRDAARRQAFDYANRIDARLVVLTDGDTYEIYDRSRGGAYDGMLRGSFRLSRFTSADSETLDLLRP